MSEYVLEMIGVSKEFPGVRALDNVNLRVRPGSVHALMGENGAGKSTLMKCLMGIYTMTTGKIIYKGEEAHIHNPITALHMGISMIHQELNPVPARSVAENIWVGREPMKNALMIDHKKRRQATIDLLKKLEISLEPDTLMRDLTVAQAQMVEIAKAVSYDASIVIMDEPTSSLTEREANQLFKIIAELKSQGVAIIYISHKMEEIFKICDEVTVFRDGQMVGSDLAQNLDIDKLISMMVGRDLSEMFPKSEWPIGETVLKVENLSSGKAFHDVSFELHRGEVLGMAGLVGAGRTEIAEAIFGIRRITGGKVYKDGKELHITHPSHAIKHGIAMLTEDRRGSGIFGVRSIMHNTTIANMGSYKKAGIMLDHKKMQVDALEYIKKLNIKTPSAETPISSLSGGNQQKVLVARWLLTNPDVLIVDEPTRGIDVGAKSEIHSLITQLAGEGKAIIVISSEMPEVLGVSDRVLVMHEGKMTAIVDRSEATQELVMKYATEA